MAKQKGRLLLINIGDGAGSEAFAPLCGLRSKTLTINNSEIDVTTADCSDPGGELWTEVLAGTKRLSFSGNGYFKDETTELRANTVVMSDSPIANLQIVVPSFGTFAGAFFLNSMEYGGEQEDGVTYSLAGSSTGAVTFTAAS
jgi:TP901-1 family phage major tail protein